MLDVPARSEGGADALALRFPNAPAKPASASGLAPSILGVGLAGRVLAVTVFFVLLAMSLFYVTRLTAHREMLLHGKISAVQTTVAAFGMAGPTPPPHELSQKILNSVDVKWMAIETPSGSREFVLAGGPPAGVEPIKADDTSYLESIAATFHALFATPGTVVKLAAPAQANEPAIEFAFDEAPIIQSLEARVVQFSHDFADHRRRRHLRAVGGFMAHGASARAPPHLQHHCFWRESTGCFARDRALRPKQ